MIGIGLFNFLKGLKPQAALSNSLYIAGILFIIFSFFVVKYSTGNMSEEYLKSIGMISKRAPSGRSSWELLSACSLVESQNTTQLTAPLSGSQMPLIPARQRTSSPALQWVWKVSPYGFFHCDRHMGFLYLCRHLWHCHRRGGHAGHRGYDHVRGQLRPYCG